MENRAGIARILAFYSVILILNIIGTFVSRKSVFSRRNLMLELILMLIAVPLYFLWLQKKKINFTLSIYLFELPLLLITIWQDTFGDPEAFTFTFLLLLLVLPQLILDKPWRVILYILGVTFVYIIADVNAKAPQIYEGDLLHTFNACLMSIGASLFFLSIRIQNNSFINLVEERAYRDSLTGLYNRYGAEQFFKKNEPGLLLYMDLDHFKEVNDSLGHDEGDRVLQETANVLRTCFRQNDLLIRMGGDEFAVFALGKWTEDEISRKLSEVLKKIESIHAAGESEHVDIGMSASIGCVYSPDGVTELDELIRCADQKMYDVKRNGKNNFEVVIWGNRLSEANKNKWYYHGIQKEANPHDYVRGANNRHSQRNYYKERWADINKALDWTNYYYPIKK